MTFNSEFFQKQEFDFTTIRRYFNMIKADLEISHSNLEPRVKFQFAYSALIKCGITLMATLNYRVKSKEGHHVFIIENLSEILDDNDILKIGNDMRLNRNKDMYKELIIPTETELNSYLKFVDDVFSKTEEYLLKQKHLF